MNSRLSRMVLSGLIVATGLMAWPAPPSAAAPLAQTTVEPCTMTGDKVVSPARIRLGETAQIRLTLTPRCPPATYRAVDVVLAIDSSRSMLGSKDTQARKAASTFVDTLDLTLQRVAVVTFDGDPHLTIGLSQDATAIKRALTGYQLGNGTNIAGAIDMAYYDILEPHGRADALPVVVLISDGDPNRPGNGNEPQVAAVRAANFARLNGTVIIAVGMGTDANPALLKQIAGTDANYYFAPDETKLEELYRALALQVGDVALRDLTLDDDLAPNIDLVPNTASPPATVNGRRLTWASGIVPSAGLTWIYEIKPTRIGTYPTNDKAVAGFTNADGKPGTFTFPQPIITVLDPEPKDPSSCNQFDAWTLMIHSFPDTVGRAGAGPGCNNQFDGGDWVGGALLRLPDLTYELTDATGKTLLFRGKGIPGPGRVDQRIYVRICPAPPYRLKLLTSDLGGYQPCANSPAIREITARDFRSVGAKRAEVRFGYVPR